MGDRSLFDSAWPRYAIASHIAFWASSFFLVAACLGSFAALIHSQIIIWLFWLWLATSFQLGVTAMLSGRLYVGNQVFSRTPLKGWPARAVGGITSILASALIVFAYSLTFIRGG